MSDAGFFKGTSAEQDSRFANKQKKLLKQMKFPDNIDVKVDMLKVNLDVLKPWITKRLQEYLGIEDDVVIEFVFNQLEDKNPDPKMMQINLTGFLGGSKARLFIGELWKILSTAQSSPDGIPAELVEMKKKELLKRQEEDERLREIRKREEESHRQDIKPDMEKLDNRINGRNQSRYENGNVGGYKSRAFQDDHRRDRRRSLPKPRRTRDSPEPKIRRIDKKPTRSVSKSSESDDDRHHHHQEKAKPKPKPSSNRHRLPSKSPSHSRSPIKSSRKNEKPQQRPSSTDSNASHQATEKPKNRSSSSSSVDRSHKKPNDLPDYSLKKQSVSKTKSSPVKEPVSSKSKKNKKPSKRTRSLSVSRSSSNSSFSRSSSSSSSEVKSKKNKKPKKKPPPPPPTKSRSSSRSRSPSINRNKKKDDHKARKHSKPFSRKHHRSNDNKRKSHRDHPDKSKTKKIHRNESSKKKISNSSQNDILTITSSPKKPRLESQIKVQTPPPPSSDDKKVQQQEVPVKPNRAERIVVLEDSRTDSIGSLSTRVSITTQPIYNNEHPKFNNSSEDENEIDLRERLLREKAIKSMRRRQFTTTNNDIHTKTTTDRIVYETQ